MLLEMGQHEDGILGSLPEETRSALLQDRRNMASLFPASGEDDPTGIDSRLALWVAQGTDIPADHGLVGFLLSLLFRRRAA